jgi:hypothetical protein
MVDVMASELYRYRLDVFDDHRTESPPTYKAPSRASAGVASTVDDSATAMASFRINLSPFICDPTGSA